MKMSKTNYTIFAIVMICVSLLVFLITNKARQNGSVEPAPTKISEIEVGPNYNERFFVSPTSLVISKGSTSEFEITLKNAVGRIDITSEDDKIANVNQSNIWLESISDEETDSKTIVVQGLQTGTTQISINLTDVAAFDTEEVIDGSYKIDITIE